MSDRRLQDLIRFYSILNQLEKTIGGPRALADCRGQQNYFSGLTCGPPIRRNRDRGDITFSSCASRPIEQAGLARRRKRRWQDDHLQPRDRGAITPSASDAAFAMSAFASPLFNPDTQSASSGGCGA
jgi:hypothetical protein